MKIVVNKNSTLLEYLYNNLDMPKKRIKQYLVHGSIYVNDIKITSYNYNLVAGMIITIDTKSKNKTSLPFPIIFEDEHLLVVNKPSNLLTIATEKEKEKTLYHIVREYVKTKNRNNKIFIVHRLDKETSGIVIFAKDEKTKNSLQENWNEFVKLREYTAIIDGILDKKEDRVTQYLKENKAKIVYVSKKDDGVCAITNYKVIKENNNCSMISINIETGRRNQIRVLFSSMNHPIIGDKKYSDNKNKEDRLYLHANRLKIYYPNIGKDILFEIPVPPEFKKRINKR